MTVGLLGIDTGGTFTDFVLLAGSELRVHKVLSTPKAPEDAILTGISEMGLDASLAAGELIIIHGTTVATNATLEGKGVRTVYITNKGLGDVLLIGRQTRQQLYNLTPVPNQQPIDPRLTLEVDARLDAQGQEIRALSSEDLAHLARQVAALEPTSVAINLLFSFLNPEQEIAIAAQLGDQYFVSRSSMVLPEQREYERGITTWLNAWIGPLIRDYLLSLGDRLVPSKLAIMQSSGLTIGAPLAADRAVNLLLSGPAGGLAAALYLSEQVKQPRIMTFDMGGTSTDVALLEGAIRLTNQGKVGAYPVAIPMADIHTIGAGGGSIAYVDVGGLLQVGPSSAGANPGPACYGQGGRAPTVTDANLIIGRLRSDAFLGGRMPLDIDAAKAALQPLATQLALPMVEVALGIIRIANEHMIQALRVISIQQGHDPRDFALMCFGGAGGLHVCDLADALQMRRAIVPVNSGVLSALGMLTAQPGRDLVKTHNCLLADVDASNLQTVLTALLDEAQQALTQEGITETRHQYAMDLRYQGQTYCIAIDFDDAADDKIAQALKAFQDAHQQRYGHLLSRPVELVNLRVHLEALRPPLKLPVFGRQHSSTTPRRVRLADQDAAVTLHERQYLPQQPIMGPALITEAHTTVFIQAGWQVAVDDIGNLLLTKVVG
ncbi:MAG: N-methylhydantoinase A [Candidatus Azotimanducaceae bacterium]|jgi:N-methylhydantoinase A